jgi:hypothetical protein
MKKFSVGQVMGWRGESTRHSLAAKGVRTGSRKLDPVGAIAKGINRFSCVGCYKKSCEGCGLHAKARSVCAACGKKSCSGCVYARARKTMFFAPKHKQLAAIISVRSEDSAKQSVKELKGFMAKSGRRRDVQAIRSATLAANRAEAMRNKKDLSVHERAELGKIARVYRDFVHYAKLSTGR